MGHTVLHRLNQVELRQTLTDLFGPAVQASLPSGGDPEVMGFDTIASALTVSQSGVDAVMATAQTVSANLDVAALASCGAMPERECASLRIGAIAPKILRRPPDAAELESYLALWDEVRTREAADVATRAVVQRLLSSPDFLYHLELGDPTTGLLNGYEMASRLSYLAWESMPDDALWDAARSGALATKAGVRTQLARLFADPRGTKVLRRFFTQWAGVGDLENLVKDPALYPGFEALRGPMAEEFQRFVEDLVERDGTVGDLLSSSDSFVDGALADFYGVATPAGTGFAKVALDPGQRAGILTSGAFLAVHGKANKSSPILRGVFVRTRLLCSPPPPPPPGVNNIPDEPIRTTTREYYASLTSPTLCSGCHSQINPIGFALENYDAIGRWRSEENGNPVDATGVLPVGDVKGPVSGPIELAQKLAKSDTVRTCLAANWFRSRFRRLEEGADQDTVDALAGALLDNGDRIMALASAVADEDSLYRAHFRTPE